LPGVELRSKLSVKIEVFELAWISVIFPIVYLDFWQIAVYFWRYSWRIFCRSAGRETCQPTSI